MSVEIIIDPNVRVAGNRTYGGFEDVLGGFVDELTPGDPVTVLEEESDVVGDATVYEVDYEKHLVYLNVDWSSLRPRLERRTVHFAGTALIRASFSLPEDASLGDNLSSSSSVLATAG